MGFRFYRRLSTMPGLRVNLNRSGSTLSIDGRSAWLTFGPHGNRATVCLPGSCVSFAQTYPAANPRRVPFVHREPIPPAASPHAGHRSAFAIAVIVLGLLVLAAISR